MRLQVSTRAQRRQTLSSGGCGGIVRARVSWPTWKFEWQPSQFPQHALGCWTSVLDGHPTSQKAGLPDNVSCYAVLGVQKQVVGNGRGFWGSGTGETSSFQLCQPLLCFKNSFWFLALIQPTESEFPVWGSGSFYVCICADIVYVYI